MSDTETKQGTTLSPVERIKELEAEVDKLKSEAQPSEFELRRRDLLNSSFGSLSRRLAQLKRDDPAFVDKLFSNAEEHPEDFFGRSSFATLAMELKKRSPEAYRKVKSIAVNRGIVGREPLAEPTPKNAPLWR